MQSHDTYFKLRTQPPTPADEVCQCIGSKPVKLMYALTDNPIHCIDCNLEVAPDVLALDLQLVEDVVAWRDVYAVIYRLWLDSGTDAMWAKQQLLDMRSTVNTQGLAVRAALDRMRSCYVWYFQDQSDDAFTPLQVCPNCDRPFTRYSNGIFPQCICDQCKIITVSE